jgi:hypothetical protein
MNILHKLLYAYRFNNAFRKKEVKIMKVNPIRKVEYGDFFNDNEIIIKRLAELTNKIDKLSCEAKEDLFKLSLIAKNSNNKEIEKAILEVWRQLPETWMFTGKLIDLDKALKEKDE